ncbi:MAG TPA: NCS2 family permease [Coriobacteriia bacterium]|jgi:AGZA family xanthine/uracil permease-like MFS transporter
MEGFFKFKERGTDLRTEILAGVTTFMTMAYIIFVNPGILSAAGVPFPGAATATALGAALMCLCMGLITNRPFALASGMGLNAVVTFSVIGFQQANVPWQVGMSVIFLEGLIILVLVLTGLREAVMDAIPLDLKRAIGVGIGLFITTIGLNEGGFIKPAPITLVGLGDFTQRYVWVAVIGLLAILVFMALKVKGDILWGILVATAAAVVLGVTALPTQVVSAPNFSTFLAPFQTVKGGLAISQVFTPVLLLSVFAIMLTDFFDTMGTVISVGEQAGFVDAKGNVPGIREILTVDSIAASVGGLFGASSITTYIESAAGVAEGGRTGLTSVVTGALFAVAAFFAPIVATVGGGFKIPNASQYGAFVGSGFQAPAGDYFVYPITAGALIVVGFLMMRTVREIPWTDLEEAFPAFLTIVGIPLTYNISYGIGFGFISYVLIKTFHGKARQVHWLMWVVSLAFAVTFVLPAIEKLFK